MSSLILILAIIPTVLCTNHQLEGEDPSNFQYVKPLDNSMNNTSDVPDSVGGNHTPRFGFPIAYGTDLQGYNNGQYAPMKIELGGVFLGTLIGLGAVLLAPKLAHIFNQPSHGGYSRSEDNDSVMNNLSKIATRIDEALKNNQIDSMSCLERAACTYMQSYANQSMSDSSNSNSFIDFFIEGSKLKTALEKGVNGVSCSKAYPQCSLSKNSLISGLQSMILSNAI